jgi:hypothetical protein
MTLKFRCENCMEELEANFTYTTDAEKVRCKCGKIYSADRPKLIKSRQ